MCILHCLVEELCDRTNRPNKVDIIAFYVKTGRDMASETSCIFYADNEQKYNFNA
jgi:hypothetical protein